MYIRTPPATEEKIALTGTDSISRDAGNSRNSRNRRDGSMSRDAATVKAAAPKISNSRDAATISAIAETTSACSRSTSRDDANSTKTSASAV